MNINLTSAAVILWSGMLIIAGAVLVLSSQVRHLVDLLESRPSGPTSLPAEATRARTTRVVLRTNRARNAGRRGVAVEARRSVS